MYGVDKGGMSNVIQGSPQTLHTEAVAAGVASQTSKPGKRSDMRDLDDLFEDCWSPHDTGESDGSRHTVQRQPSCTASRWHRSQEDRNGFQTARGSHALIRGDGY
ncbi:hypothetical protein SVAN01_06907 [Stagonosporopsis vannaccii]|nr:hypothetical protein SVAN01_06907 [Stagonosporopsis vannaccii]